MQTKQHIELDCFLNICGCSRGYMNWQTTLLFIVTLNNTTLKILRTSLHYYMFHGPRLSDFAVFVSGRIHSLKSVGRIMTIEREERRAEG